jgi:hypothetical protein
MFVYLGGGVPARGEQQVRGGEREQAGCEQPPGEQQSGVIKTVPIMIATR